MRDLLARTAAGSVVLDLGCAAGSFPSAATPATVVRADRSLPSPQPSGLFVCADAAALPFRDGVFTGAVANHSLEHFDNLQCALVEIGRVVKPGGWLFVTVPDAATLSDRLYRWLAKGGGHVNAFRSAGMVSEQIERSTGLRHISTKALCSSFSFLNRRTSPRPRSRRLALLGGGFPWTLFVASWVTRWADRLLGTRLSALGWAFHFGSEPGLDADLSTWRNVCIRCGAGHPAPLLLRNARMTRLAGIIKSYRCPHCGTLNPFFDF
jgi:SAM-dependent methyltransferase